MNRKNFLQRIIPASAALLWGRDLLASPTTTTHHGKLPKYLKPGATIAITCPASPMTLEDVQYCVTTLQNWGYKVRLGNTIGLQWQRFAGTDDQRANDLQTLLDDDDVDAVLFGCGGYGVMRMMDKINWRKFAAKPKWLVGFSDITAFHCHINRLYGIPTLHADMANGFTGMQDAPALSIKDALSGKKIEYTASPNQLNRNGTASGVLVGGNLSLIYAMQGSKSELQTHGKILLIEDRGEYKYNVDRMLMNLKRSGKLNHLSGLVAGGFSASKEAEEINYTLSIEEIIYDKVKEYNYPVCFNFPVGHQAENMALKLGMNYRLSVTNEGCSLKEKTMMPAKNQL